MSVFTVAAHISLQHNIFSLVFYYSRVQADVYSIMPHPIPHYCANWKTISPECCTWKNYTLMKCWVKRVSTGFFNTGLLRALIPWCTLQIFKIYSILQIYLKICTHPPPRNKAFCTEFLSSQAYQRMCLSITNTQRIFKSISTKKVK